MLVRTVTMGLVIGCAAPAMAQTAPPATSQAQSAAPSTVSKPAVATDRDIRYAIQMMEATLVVAVARGVDDIASQFKDIDPNLQVFSGSAKAQGVLIDGYGMLFHVEMPTIRVAMILAYRSIVAPQGAARPANTTVPASASAIQQQKVDNADVMQDPTKAYHTAEKDSLINALLDSVVLPLQARDMVKIWATSEDEGNRSTMTLTVKAADLAAFRKGSLTRDEISKRVTVQVF